MRIFGAKRCRACRRCWVLAPQNAVNTAKNCCAERWAVVLSVLLLLGLARALRCPCFFRFGFRAFWRARARAQPQPQNAAIYGVLLHLRFRPGLRAALFGLLFWVLWRARARDPMSAFWVGARIRPRKPTSPALSGLRWATCIA